MTFTKVNIFFFFFCIDLAKITKYKRPKFFALPILCVCVCVCHSRRLSTFLINRWTMYSRNWTSFVYTFRLKSLFYYYNIENRENIEDRQNEIEFSQHSRRWIDIDLSTKLYTCILVSTAGFDCRRALNGWQPALLIWSDLFARRE